MRLALGVMLAATALFATGVMAQETARIGDLTVDGAWTRAAASGARSAAVYFVVHNHGAAPDRLIAAASDAAERVELHVHRHEGNVARMVKVSALDIPAHGQAQLIPGGGHVMLVGPRSPLAEGQTLSLSLTFEKAGTLRLDVPVMRRPPGGAHHGHGG